MICSTCKRETDGRNHNDRGLRCTFCWELLPALSEGKPPGEATRVQILATNVHLNEAASVRLAADDVYFNNVMFCNATARAQALAAAHGVDLETVTGSGKGGRITVGDVRQAMQ